MPNWVHNTLDVTGTAASAFEQAVEAALAKGIGFLPHLIPPPPYTEEDTIRDEDGEVRFYALSNDRRLWDNQNWGVKWGDCSTTLCDDIDGTVTVRFDTAWGPADVGIAKVSELYPAAVFTVHSIEEQPSFRSRVKFQNGEMIEEAEENCDILGEGLDYDNDPETAETYWRLVWTEIGDTIHTSTGREWAVPVDRVHKLALEGEAFCDALNR